MKNVVLEGALKGTMLTLLAAGTMLAQQQAVPTPGCSATPAQLAANRKAAMGFFAPGGTLEDKSNLIGPGYIQHNPAIKKAAEDAHVSDFDQIHTVLQRLFGPGGQLAGGGRGRGAGPQPPAGNQFEVVTAECDIVTMIHKQYRQDPTAEPGKFYEAFTFDTFRVKDGKVIEHWDNAVINPPAPAAGAGRAQ
jgi:predicted SnoaL-like aldol condensation-catalyzing enzyme